MNKGRLKKCSRYMQFNDSSHPFHVYGPALDIETRSVLELGREISEVLASSVRVRLSRLSASTFSVFPGDSVAFTMDF